MTLPQAEDRIAALENALENVLDIFDDATPDKYYIEVDIATEDDSTVLSDEQVSPRHNDALAAAFQLLYNPIEPDEDYE